MIVKQLKFHNYFLLPYALCVIILLKIWADNKYSIPNEYIVPAQKSNLGIMFD